MYVGSKFAIFKVKEIKPKTGRHFYYCSIYEKISNNGNKEIVFYNAFIYDVSFEIEPVQLLNEKEKNKYDFSNIANPDKSVFYIDSFKFEFHKKENSKSYQPCIYIYKISKTSHYNGAEIIKKSFEKKIENLKYFFEQEKNKFKEKINKNLSTIKEMRGKNALLSKEIIRLNKIIEKTQNSLENSKNEVKEIKKMKKKEVIKNAEYFDFEFEDI